MQEPRGLLQSARSGTEAHGEKTPDLHDQLRQRLSPLVAKAEKKGRTKAEVDKIISWLTGYDQKALETELKKRTDSRNSMGKPRNSIPPAR